MSLLRKTVNSKHSFLNPYLPFAFYIFILDIQSNPPFIAATSRVHTLGIRSVPTLLIAGFSCLLIFFFFAVYEERYIQ